MLFSSFLEIQQIWLKCTITVSLFDRICGFNSIYKRFVESRSFVTFQRIISSWKFIFTKQIFIWVSWRFSQITVKSNSSFKYNWGKFRIYIHRNICITLLLLYIYNIFFRPPEGILEMYIFLFFALFFSAISFKISQVFFFKYS